MPPVVTRCTIAIPPAAQERVDAHGPPAWDAPDDGQIFSVDCGDGYRAHVSLLLEAEGFVADAALFHRGEEVDSLSNEHRYQILGDYVFEHDGRRFVISVVEAAPDSNRKHSGRRQS